MRKLQSLDTKYQSIAKDVKVIKARIEDEDATISSDDGDDPEQYEIAPRVCQSPPPPRAARSSAVTTPITPLQRDPTLSSAATETEAMAFLRTPSPTVDIDTAIDHVV